MTLWFVFALMTAAAIFAVLWPLSRSGRPANDGSEAGVERVQADYWKAAVERAKQQVDRAELRSPIDGVIATPHVENLAGRRLQFGETFAEVLDTSSAVVDVAVEDTPVLSSNFQSTVPGLYFVGASAANTFGPLLRFAFGAGFTAGRLSKHLAKSAIRRPATDRSSSEIKASDRDEVSVR